MVRLRSPQVPSQKGFASILILVVLLIGLGLGVWLIQQKTNLFPKAKESSPSDNTLLSRINDLEAKSEKIHSNQISGERTVKVPVEVFEDLNRNGVKDEGEVGIPNLHVEGTAFMEVSNPDKPEFKPVLSLSSNNETDANGASEFRWATPGILTKGDQEFRFVLKAVLVNIGTYDKGNIVNAFPGPIGWSRTNSPQLFFKLYPSDPAETIILDPSGETVLETAKFPIIGNQKISGHVSYSSNNQVTFNNSTDKIPQPSIAIILDASKANNATKKVYVTYSKEDGSFEFDSLPPLSQYRLKASTYCPWKVMTSPYEGLTLGSAGITSNYDFNVVYNENDSCVTQ